MFFLRFIPIYKQKIWGGRCFKDLFKRSLIPNYTVGESWELVDRPGDQSVVAEGKYQGKTLRFILENDGLNLMGPHWDCSRRFPILVKWLDCQDRLSLQVHPPEAIAKELNGEPKTECWYIANKNSNAELIAGLKKNVTRKSFAKALEQKTLTSLVHRIPVKNGDSLFVPSGRLHAIDKGNLILEIQQNSDTTYRVYDWERLGLDGKPRNLQLEESLKSIDFDDFEPSISPSNDQKESVIADCNYFRIRKFKLVSKDEPIFLKEGNTRLLHLVKGNLTVIDNQKNRYLLSAGQNALLSYAGEWKLFTTEDSILLITDNFS